MNIAFLLAPGSDKAETLRPPLASVGHDCTMYQNTNALLNGLRDSPCDLLLLEARAIPAKAERGVAQIVHDARLAVGGVLPVLVLIDARFAAEELTETLAKALDAGVDDLLFYPVRRAELLARVGVLLRRAWPHRQSAEQLRLGDYVFDAASMSVSQHGKRIDLTRKEFSLALLFFQKIGHPLSRATLRDAIWAPEVDAGASSRTVDTHVSRVRSKLGLQDGALRLVPVYGYGYLLEAQEMDAQ